MITNILYVIPHYNPVSTTPPLKFSGAIVPRLIRKTLFMNTKFTVVACNPSNEGKTFVWKLSANQTAKVFGITKTIKRTYYIGGMPSQVAIGHELEEDLIRFDVVEREFEHPESGEKLMLKWLHVKAQ